MTDEMGPPTADRQVVHDWLTHLYSGCPGYLSICSDKDGWAGRRFTTDGAGLAAAADYAVALDKRAAKGVYAQVTTLREKPAEGRGGEDLAYGLTHLWADGDYGTIGHKPGPDDLPAPPDTGGVQKVVAESGLPTPSGWAHTGGGYNPVWVLAENHLVQTDEDRQRVKAVTTGLQAILAAQAYRLGWSWDVEVGNLDRLMKVPGTVNRKEGLERPTAIGPGTGEVHELADLAAVVANLAPAARELLEQAGREKQERKAQRTGAAVPPPRRERPAGLHSGDGPLDVLADMLTFRDLLEPEGWTYVGQSGGRDRWLRPTAGGDGPSSAYSLVCDDHVAVNWSERSDLPVGALPAGQKLTIGTLYAHLHYGGNTGEAARDVMRAAAGRATRGPAGRLPAPVLAEVKRRCVQDNPPAQGYDMWAGAEKEPPNDTAPEGSLPPGYQAQQRPDEPEPSRRSWRGQDLSAFVDGSHKPAMPAVGARADGVGVLYPGRMSTVAAESEAGKTWFAMILTIQELNRGNHVLFLDFEDEAAGVVGRLMAMGADADALLLRFHYVRPEEPLGMADMVDLAEILALGPSLAVVDGVTEGMSLHGLNINDNKDVAVFGRKVLRPLQDAGPAVVTLDHVVKSTDNRGRYAIGGVHKLNGLNGVMYLMENVQPFGIGVKGRSRVRIAKDRPGQLRKEALPHESGLFWFADLVVDATQPGPVEAVLYPPIERQAEEEAEAEREADAKQEADTEARKVKVLATLKQASEPLSGRTIGDLVPGRASVTRRALARLVQAGEVATVPGPKGAVLHVLAESEGADQ